MDIVSGAIGFLGNAITVVKLVKSTLDDIKDAPQALQTLHDRVAFVEMLLLELQMRQADGAFQSDQDLTRLEQVRLRGQKCIEELQKYANTVRKMKSQQSGKVKIDWVKWLMNRGTLDGLRTQFQVLETALMLMMNLLNSRFQVQTNLFVQESRQWQSDVGNILTELDSSHTEVVTHLRQITSTQAETRTLLLAIGPSATTQPTGTATICSGLNFPHLHDQHSTQNPTLPSHRLRCLRGCKCRCHSFKKGQVIPASVMKYVGRVGVSVRLLHKLGLYPWECNVQTCRRDLTAPTALTWSLPLGFPHFDLQVRLNRPWIYVSLHAPNIIPYDSLVWRCIGKEDINGLRMLFENREASVYDVNKDGGTLLKFAVNTWVSSRSDMAQKIIKFLVDAGADPDFNPGNLASAKTALFRTSLAILVNTPNETFAHRVRVTSFAVDICQSAFGVDVAEVAEDVLDQMGIPHSMKAALGFWPQAHPSHTPLPSAGSILQALTRFTPLEYCIFYETPEDVFRLLERGEDAKAGAPVAVAASRPSRGEPAFLKPLLSAGANVNCKLGGRTPLLWACWYANIDVLRELRDLAGAEIDWTATSPDGKDALDVVARSPYLSELLLPEREEFFTILRERSLGRKEVEEEDDEDYSLRMPGAWRWAVA